MSNNSTRQMGQTLLNAALLDTLTAAQDHASALALQQSLKSPPRNLASEARADVLAIQHQKMLEVVASQSQIIQQKDEALRAKDALILEWMHSNEAFKKLARNYGKKLGVTDAQRASDFAHAVVDLAEEDPKFTNTNMANAMRDEIKSSRP